MPKKSAKPIAPAPAASGNSDSPKPSVEPQRPGTSGTELLLTTNRRTASAQYLAAQRAETAYKAKKRSAGARQHRADAKSHFKQSAFHLREGVRSCWGIAGAVPWMVREWKEERKTQKEKKAVERYMEKKRKLEERIKLQEGEKGKEGEGEEAAPAA
ncbi:hypothetical protein BU26DRAFT_516999 [Trematosphaeria pertusa]|uniref:Uncharacterized protein n=1 Tax=Trematosphaeria pertusa TaxID=390896 RepID=A0A6A6IPE9_9PLEO|nr:uncharacterized protein BU26DRAFT_516999 [Trematosphaeria pertusa]KAF2252351.1 hypothetical protein BU26DRAFT_516999 [Trematosphaeria pertusa]